MPYCADCDMVTAQTDSPTCPACGAVLIAIADVACEDRDRPVVLKCCGNPYEAEVLRAALDAEGIDAIIEDVGLLASVFPRSAHGDATGARVLIRLEDAEAGLDLLRRKQAGELTIPDDDLPGEGTEETPT